MTEALVLLTSEPVLTSLPGLLALASASLLRRSRTVGSRPLLPASGPEGLRPGWMVIVSRLRRAESSAR